MRTNGDTVHSTKPDEPGVGDLAKQALADAKQWGRAEATYYKALAADRSTDAGIGIGLGFAALMLAQAMLTTLLVGIVIALSATMSAAWATLIVVVLTAIVIAVIGRMALARFKLAARPLPEAGA